MNVLIIPEDFRKDQYVLKPIIERMMNAVGKRRATIRVCQDPLLGGIDQALRWERISEILDRYRGMVDLFLLIVDRDGDCHRRSALDNLETEADRIRGGRLLAENAWQEVEVWVLAGHDLPADWNWRDVREDPNPKERYFEPFAELGGVLNSPGGGRKRLAQEAARRYPRIRMLCPEVGDLESRIRHSKALPDSRAAD